MRVLMVVRGMDYGFGAHVKWLVAGLRRLGVTVDLLNAGSDQGAALAPWRHKGRFRDADVVHYHGSPYNVMKTDRPTVVTVHTLLSTELLYDSSFASRFGQHLEPLSIRNADVVIAVNKCLEHDILNIDPDAIIAVVPNGVNFDEVTYSRTPAIPPNVLSGGRLVRRKGFATLIDAMAMVARPFHLSIFGDGPLISPLIEQMQRELRGRGDMLGYVPRNVLLSMYRNADVFVCASLYETGPITVLEAMATGVPVVCSDMDAVDGVVIDEYTGLIFERGNATDLARQVDRLLVDKALRDALSANAREHVERNHNWTRLARMTKEIYEGLLEGLLI